MLLGTMKFQKSPKNCPFAFRVLISLKISKFIFFELSTQPTAATKLTTFLPCTLLAFQVLESELKSDFPFNQFTPGVLLAIPAGWTLLSGEPNLCCFEVAAVGLSL